MVSTLASYQEKNIAQHFVRVLKEPTQRWKLLTLPRGILRETEAQVHP